MLTLNYEGRPLKELEHPGMWNRVMYNWNILYVENLQQSMLVNHPSQK